MRSRAPPRRRGTSPAQPARRRFAYRQTIRLKSGPQEGHAQPISSEGAVEPRFQLCGQEPEDEVHRPAGKLARRRAEPALALCLSPEIVLEAHVVGECERCIVDVDEVRDELLLAVDGAGDLL